MEADLPRLDEVVRTRVPSGSVLAGDAYRALVQAIAATGNTAPDKLAAYLKNDLKDFSGLTGKISFNEKGDRVGDLYRVYEVDADGKFVPRP